MSVLLRISLLALLPAAPLTAAATLLVDTTSDSGDAAFQVCDADPDNANCSLRGAILAANASNGLDTIAFAIPLTDSGYVASTQHWRFSPATDYPPITQNLAIEGYTQPGALENTLAPDQGGSDAVLKIEVHGAGAEGSTGFNTANGGATLTVRGLAINRFRYNVMLYQAGQIEGCFIGTDISGTQAMATGTNGVGIYLRGVATIGGTTPAARNLISGNGGRGIWDVSSTGPAQTIQGNLFGLDASGAAVLPGQDYAIVIESAAHASLIGGNTAAARNLFAGLGLNAIYVNSANGNPGSAPPVHIVGNVFGTDWSGALSLPNGGQFPSQPQPTINVFGAGGCGVQIGSDAAGEGNLIANGAGAGVQIATCTGAAVVGNAFRGNRRGAIDLSATSNADGPTANDPGDGDAGGNRLQNFPVTEQIVYAGANVTLTYRVDTALGNAHYPLRIDVARGHGGQAEFPIVIDTYSTGDAQQPKSVTFAAAALDGGGTLVLNATDADGNTSESYTDMLFEDGFDQGSP